MFHQMMYQLHGKGWRERSDEKVTALSDVLFYAGGNPSPDPDSNRDYAVPGVW